MTVERTDGPSFIGIDLGGTHLRVALVDATGHAAVVQRVASDASGPAAVMAQIETLVTELRGSDTAGIGIGIPGTFDGASGVVRGIPALPGWGGIPLAAELRARTGLPCVLENDAKVAAIGEWRSGAGQGCDNFVYVTIGTGIGSAAIVDGRLQRGAGGLAGEVGHTRVTDGGERCACGLIGCWQAVASGTALGHRARAAIAADPSSRLAAIAGSATASGTHIVTGAREGDAECLRLLAEHAEMLGYGFANLQHIHSPELFVVGGGLSALLDLLRPGIEQTLRERLLPGFQPARLAPAALGDDAGIIGAAACARDLWHNSHQK